MKREPNPNFYRVRYTLPPLNPRSHDKELFQDATHFVLLAGMLTVLVATMGVLGLIPFLVVMLICRRWIYDIVHSA
ncbi:MAG: hypothetical protein R3E39_08035 [Anaerolineae bacterium]